MRKTGRKYPAKIMLFGEYTVIMGSMGLIIPYSRFSGSFDFYNTNSSSQNTAKKSNQQLLEYFEFLRDVVIKKYPDIRLDIHSLFSDLKQGLYFDSDIPQSCGLGSSGALCAAMYDAYYSDKIIDPNNSSDLQALTEIFSTLESWFHGKSSGYDPLTAYLDSPLLIEAKTSVDRFTLKDDQIKKSGFFLINAGGASQTQPLVKIFMKNCENPEYLNSIRNELIPVNNSCIEAFIKGDENKLAESFADLSRLQFEHFIPMIPEKIHDIWQKGIQSGDYMLKLCGSGGGGYILGITNNIEKMAKQFYDSGVEWMLI